MFDAIIIATAIATGQTMVFADPRNPHESHESCEASVSTEINRIAEEAARRGFIVEGVCNELESL